MAEYHVMSSCNKCSGENEVESTAFDQGMTSEAKTECKTCGFTDYWAYGFFESGSEMESNCRKYYAGGR